jgi:ABC-type Fe3+ transport system permease subunit
MNIAFTILIVLVSMLMVLCLVGFVIDTFQHNKWLNEQEKYWNDKRKE